MENISFRNEYVNEVLNGISEYITKGYVSFDEFLKSFPTKIELIRYIERWFNEGLSEYIEIEDDEIRQFVEENIKDILRIIDDICNE